MVDDFQRWFTSFLYPSSPQPWRLLTMFPAARSASSPPGSGGCSVRPSGVQPACPLASTSRPMDSRRPGICAPLRLSSSSSILVHTFSLGGICSQFALLVCHRDVTVHGGLWFSASIILVPGEGDHVSVSQGPPTSLSAVVETCQSCPVFLSAPESAADGQAVVPAPHYHPGQKVWLATRELSGFLEVGTQVHWAI